MKNLKDILFRNTNILEQFSINYLKENYFHHINIIVIAFLVILFNILFANNILADQETSSYLIDPEAASKIASEVSKYTYFEEDLDRLNLSLKISANDEYICKNDFVDTQKSKLERHYIVKKGDTITTIADKFDMHVASILERNSLTVDSMEQIRPGDEIIIPSKDNSNSKQWLVDLNYKKEQERKKQLALAKKRRQEARKRKLAQSRSVYTRNRPNYSSLSSSSYSGNFSGGFSVPISHNGISRGLSRYHAGIDYRANIGTPVHAAASGKVIGITSGWGSGYGKSILISHGSGYTTRYAHLNQFAVSVGQSVSAGQIIGYSGNTGWSTGPHLHFETRINGKPINPF